MLTVTTIASMATMTHSSEEMSGKEMERRRCANPWHHGEDPSVCRNRCVPGAAYWMPVVLKDW